MANIFPALFIFPPRCRRLTTCACLACPRRPCSISARNIQRFLSSSWPTSSMYNAAWRVLVISRIGLIRYDHIKFLSWSKICNLRQKHHSWAKLCDPRDWNTMPYDWKVKLTEYFEKKLCNYFISFYTWHALKGINLDILMLFVDGCLFFLILGRVLRNGYWWCLTNHAIVF